MLFASPRAQVDQLATFATERPPGCVGVPLNNAFTGRAGHGSVAVTNKWSTRMARHGQPVRDELPRLPILEIE
jgi:hypothetical protein